MSPSLCLSLSLHTTHKHASTPSQTHTLPTASSPDHSNPLLSPKDHMPTHTHTRKHAQTHARTQAHTHKHHALQSTHTRANTHPLQEGHIEPSSSPIHTGLTHKQPPKQPQTKSKRTRTSTGNSTPGNSHTGTRIPSPTPTLFLLLPLPTSLSPPPLPPPPHCLPLSLSLPISPQHTHTQGLTRRHTLSTTTTHHTQRTPQTRFPPPSRPRWPQSPTPLFELFVSFGFMGTDPMFSRHPGLAGVYSPGSNLEAFSCKQICPCGGIRHLFGDFHFPLRHVRTDSSLGPFWALLGPKDQQK
jgi:hypothetical protein